MNFQMVINPVYESYLETDAPIEIYYGGTSSGKSFFIEQKKLFKLITQPGHNYLILRKSAIDVRNSVWALLKQVILKYELSDYVKLNETAMSAKFFNGNQLLCKGLDDVEDLKSITFESGPLTDIHIEEATQISSTDFDKIEMRLRGRSGVRKQIILSFNPISQLHWLKKRWFDNPEPEVMILKTTYLDNLYLMQEDIDRIEKYKVRDPAFYKVYGLGEWGSIGGLIFNNWEVVDFPYTDEDMPIYCGQDWGVNDPAACIKVGMKDQNIYIFEEFYQTGITSNRQLYEMEKSVIGKHTLICDSAEPKSIEDFKSFGVDARKAEKGKDSVIHGIKWLSARKIFVKPHCYNTIKELQSYKWIEDKTGKNTERPIDAFNHACDAIRYSSEPWMIPQDSAPIAKTITINHTRQW
jgi:phage terminase large subunit